MSDNLLKIKKLFRCLDDWVIEYDNVSEYKGQCCRNAHTKKATIYGKNGLKVSNYKYLLHEVLHIAFASASLSKENEELFVRDLCKIIKIRKSSAINKAIIIMCQQCSSRYRGSFHPKRKYQCPKCGHQNQPEGR